VSGFVVEKEAEALSAIKHLPDLDRRGVRAAFERRFSAKRMAQDYVSIYGRLAATHGRAQTIAAQ
jgi:hexokinase